MGSFIDLTGKKYGRLTVIGRDDHRKSDRVLWLCKCDCGNTTIVSGGNLRSGHTRSCGCLRLETEASHFLSHDQTRKNNKRLYSILKSMKRRCYSPKHYSYKNYGGRGIKICDEWLGKNGLQNFVEWANLNGYDPSLSIDRINVNGDYSPKNCRWVTLKENANNKTDNRYIQCFGETKTLSQWADSCGITQAELKRRLDYLGLPIEAAIAYRGVPKTEYKGRVLSIRNLAHKYHIDYKTFLFDVLVNGKTGDDIIGELCRG